MKIPLRIASAGNRSAVRNTRGLSIPLNLFGQQTSSVAASSAVSAAGAARLPNPSDRDEVMRTIVVTAGLIDPADSVKWAEISEDNPEKTVLPELDDNKIQPVLAAVQAAQASPGSGPSATAEQVEVARLAGVRPALVAAAAAEVAAAGSANEIKARGAALRKFGAAFDPDLLRSAANTGARSQLYAVVPTRQGRLDKIESDIGELKASLDAISEKIDKLAAGGRTETAKSNRTAGR